MISPGFPAEMPLFTQGLAEVGARVFGIGDQPRGGLAPEVRASLTDYLQIANYRDADTVIEQVQQWLRGRSVDRIESLWEPCMVLAAQLRESLGVPGMTVEQTIPFRDKESMKQKLDQHGIRTPHHYRAHTRKECEEAAERIGYPLIIKPIAGAGSSDTYELQGPEDMEEALMLLDHVSEVSVEEFIEGEEYTFDTVCYGGKDLYHNVSWYRPKPLVARQNAWMSPQAISLRDTSVPEIQVGVDMGREVIKALGFQDGFTHMEWFRKPDGEAVFGEIGARAPGGRLVHLMNYASDMDLFTGWAEAICRGRISQDTTKQFNAGVVFKRAQGSGIIQRIEGMESLLARYGESIANIELVPIGSPRRDWRKVVVADGWVVVRHPDLDTTIDMANHVSTDLRIFAG